LEGRLCLPSAQASPSPREERAGRGSGRGELNKDGLLSPALSSFVPQEEREKRPRCNGKQIRKTALLAVFAIAPPDWISILAAMKWIIRNVIGSWILVGLCATPLSRAVADDSKELTAYQLIKEGNRYLGEESKDKVVQIRSEKSIGTLTPNIWFVVYFDPDAAAKAAEVKFIAGKKDWVHRSPRILELGSKAHLPLNREKMKVDSDKAIEIATKEPVLKNLKVLATRLTLEHRGEETDAPVWRVRLWAAKLRNPSKDVDIGEVVQIGRASCRERV